ncbi:hypothetical protein P7C73_g4320, partial [Tremellales sp. Uapishka_1]
MTTQAHTTPQSFAAFVPRASTIQTSGRHFIDEHGRVLDLRGANVGGASKVWVDPFRMSAYAMLKNGPLSPSNAVPFHDHADSSYVDRPFPLDEAENHWKRLKSWGMTFVRINVTWEALEHAGPGKYDEAYLIYLRELLEGMAKFGLVAYISIHQDVFSRYCGGSGAPGWTLEAAGLVLADDGDKLAKSGSAFLDGVRGGRLEGERGLWPTGYTKLAAASMNTLFWGGETFAPEHKVRKADGSKVNIQQYLQDAFLGAYGKLVEAVGDLDCVMGFELMNEPHPGFIGLPSIHEWNYNTDLHLGPFPSPLEAISLGSGHPTLVANYVRTFPFPTRVSGKTLANPTGVSVWKAGCPWEKAGVWKWSKQKGKAVALKEDYFKLDKGGFYADFYFPFVGRWKEMMEEKGMGGKCQFVEVLPNEYCPAWPEVARPSNFVFAPHWYDLNALFKKQFGFMSVNVQGLSRGMFLLNALYWGKGVKDNYALQIRTIVDEARKQLGAVPIVFGECGIPMDLNGEKAFRNGDWKAHERMMDAMISAFEASLVGYNLWTYNPLNRDDIGDDWNAENFSWYSDVNREKELGMIEHLSNAEKTAASNDLDLGGRLLNAVVRPYAVATAGTPISLSYDYETGTFAYRFFSTPSATSQVTEIYLPGRIYKESDIRVLLSQGGTAVFAESEQRLYVTFEAAPISTQGKGKELVRRVDVFVPTRAAAAETGTIRPEWILAVLLILAAVFLSNLSVALSCSLDPLALLLHDAQTALNDRHDLVALRLGDNEGRDEPDSILPRRKKQYAALPRELDELPGSSGVLEPDTPDQPAAPHALFDQGGEESRETLEQGLEVRRGGAQSREERRGVEAAQDVCAETRRERLAAEGGPVRSDRDDSGDGVADHDGADGEAVRERFSHGHDVGSAGVSGGTRGHGGEWAGEREEIGQGREERMGKG